ncbi:hypothetical protein C4H12_09125 [Capnocytophaga sp. oral taxon 878]|nr:hypothetical protein C4H12_09125 [Capnocytophaga sp. oral taxon 878]
MKYMFYPPKKIMSDFLYIIVLTLLILKIFFAYLESSSFFSTNFLSYLFSIKPDIVEFTSNFSIKYLIKLCFLLIWISSLHFIVFKAMKYILKKWNISNFSYYIFPIVIFVWHYYFPMIMIVIFLTFNEYVSAKEILEICINPFLWVQ